MRKITIIRGDGIGPDVVDATLNIFKAAGVAFDYEFCEAGAEVFKKGDATGVPKDTIASIERNKVVLKGPLETPVGFGEKSANVTLRKMFELFANIRPVRELPSIKTPFSGRNIDLVVVRENVEDLYAGIEHMQTPSVAQCLKLISRMGSEKVIRAAFSLAKAEGRKKVHCATKSNIMKLSEGLFKRTFEDLAKNYPDIEAKHIIIDNCAHQMVIRPEEFDVVVTTNLNGDILSDLTSGLVGGLGVAPGANYGESAAIFEAVHGSAPDIAGKNLANPMATLLSGIMMLRYLDETQKADTIEKALYKTLEDGVMTKDLLREKGVGTREFTETIISNLGKKPAQSMERTYRQFKLEKTPPQCELVQKRRDMGVDVFVESATSPREVGESMVACAEGSRFKLKMISNRGTQVFPSDLAGTDCTDVFRCRFMTKDGEALTDDDVFLLLKSVSAKFRWMHVEKLAEFNGAPAYTKAQGEA